jgi:hypothetical protein
MFKSSISYTDRRTRADYIFDKYKSILTDKVLDVGADAMYLKKKIVDTGTHYTGMGFGEGIDVNYNLEQTPYPFQDNEFGTVICFDVLEHLENIHDVFKELSRISGRFVIISLPNPWAHFFSILRKGDYSDDVKMKFYGLPTTKPDDRHRWFFSEKEARVFIEKNSAMNGLQIKQADAWGEDKKMGGNGLKGFFGRFLLKLIFRKDIDQLGLHHGTLWFVLEKKV